MVRKQGLTIFSKRYRMQILVTLAAHIMTLSHGIGLGWLSPTLLILQSPRSPLEFKVAVEDVSWIGSIFGLGSLTSNIFFGLLAARIARKTNMYLLAIPHMLFWILNYFAQSVEYLYASRFFAGLTSGGLYVIGPVFISEISAKEIRGALTSLAMMFYSCGILIGFILPSYLDYHLIPCIVIFLSIIYFAVLSLFPDTPGSLLERGQLEEAEKAFNFYNNIDRKVTVRELCVNELQTSTAISDFEELKASKLKGGKATSITLQDFFNKSALKKFAIAFVLCLQNQFSSSFAFVNYMSHIFAESGSTLNPQDCTIFVGVVQILCTLLASILVEKFGRKTLMLTSTAGMALGMFGFGAFVQFTDDATKAEYNWVPLVAVAFVTATASFGVISLTFTIIVEILPAKIRAQAQSIAMMFCSIMVFITLKLYPYFLFNLGISITMYSCASSCVFTGVYLLIFLPETKGKSMAND
ncbi:facilitated trehalose transporter Tret1-like [Bactrocera tryoni]|uniref:facilitated trehalose transporter Tret1-like n=1 Tax=Bactrocera tryoni TaxID=59916 RepID=UPI001A9798F9|nr:facilitated trehalose transporter Tret1-like [Bactrocera tryoni]XP_039948275.1 facilitated trehalose transporter Tret1-like [Bactrocera tryoni]XP_039948276.1 facilitated trehalose transporter Tret1-like [Bactrocera tryoni]